MNRKNEETEEIEEIEEADLEVSDDESRDSDDIEFEEDSEEDDDYDLGKVETNEPEATRAIVIPLTQTQYEVVMLAIQHIKDQFDYPIGDGKATEILAAEYLAGATHE